MIKENRLIGFATDPLAAIRTAVQSNNVPTAPIAPVYNPATRTVSNAPTPQMAITSTPVGTALPNMGGFNAQNGGGNFITKPVTPTQGEFIGNMNPTTGKVQSGPVSDADLHPATPNPNPITANNPSYDANGQISLSGLKALGINQASDLLKYQGGVSNGQNFITLNGSKVNLPPDIIAQFKKQQDQQNQIATQQQNVKDATLAKQTGNTGGATTPTTDSTTSNGDTTSTAVPPPADPATSGSTAAVTSGLAALGPAGQALAQAFQAQQDQITRSLGSSQNMTQDALTANSKAYGSVADSIDAMKQGYEDSSAQIKSLLESVKQENDQNVAIQEKAAKDQLAWTNDSQMRQASQQKTAAHNSIIAQLALQGGFGQDAGLMEVRQSDATFDSKMSDLQTQFGVDSTNLSAKFTAMYVANNNTYADGTIKNIQDLQTHLETLNTQGNQNTVAWTNAQNALLKDAWTTQTGLRKDLASSNLDAAKEMNTMITQKQTHDDALETAKNARDDRLQAQKDLQQYREDSLAASAQTHADALAAKGDATAAAALTTAYNEGRKVSSDILASIKDPNASPSISAYNSFQDVYSKVKGLTNSGQLTTTTPVTVTLLEDLMAQAGNPKLSSRVPSAVTHMYDANLSPAQNALAFEQKFMGNGKMTDTMFNDIIGSLKGMNDQATAEATKEASGYIVSAIYRNSLLPAGYQHYGLSVQELGQALPTSLIQGAFTGLNANLPKGAIPYSMATPGVLGNVDSGGMTPSSAPVNHYDVPTGDTSARTDRNNNPIAAAVPVGGTNYLTKSLDNAGIKWSYDPQTFSNGTMTTIKIDGDPIEASRTMLANTPTIQDWYKNHTGSSVLSKYGVQTNEDFKKLPVGDQNTIIKEIYHAEVGNGSLVASI